MLFNDVGFYKFEENELNPLSPRLIKFSVNGLYGEFDHIISLNSEKHVTAIIAPNGMGKTLCLKLIQALYESDWYFFDSVEFGAASYYFDDESYINITKVFNDDQDHLTDLKIDFYDGVKKRKHNWTQEVSNISPSLVRKRAPFMRLSSKVIG